MARSKNIENMSYAELTAMQARIERAKAERQSADRAELKQKMADMAKKHGFEIRSHKMEMYGHCSTCRGKRS